MKEYSIVRTPDSSKSEYGVIMDITDNAHRVHSFNPITNHIGDFLDSYTEDELTPLSRISDYHYKEQYAYKLVEFIEIYDNLEPTGGCNHVTLSDQNYGTDNTQYCLDVNDFFGFRIAVLLNQFTADEQKILLECPWIIKNIIETHTYQPYDVD